jgi:hypothetical protein
MSAHHGSISSSHGDCKEATLALGGRSLVEHGGQKSFAVDALIAATFVPQDAQTKPRPRDIRFLREPLELQTDRHILEEVSPSGLRGVRGPEGDVGGARERA